MTSRSATATNRAPARAEPDSPVLETRNLRVTYPSRHGREPARAVDDVSLTIGRGEIVALVGESGCGKSTLARALIGLMKPTGGEVCYDGAPLSYQKSALRSYRRHVQFVLQDPGGALNPRQNVFDAVAEGPLLHGLRTGLKTRVANALRQAGLRPPEAFFQRYPHELSGGQQQRVVIAGTLALEPSVIVADEPVSSLDASVRGEILKLILQLRDQLGLSCLIVSHDLGLAWNVADRVAVMYLGRIVEIGPVPDILLNPKHPYTRALIAALPDARRDAPVVALEGEPPDPTAIPSGCRFRVRCPLHASLSDDDPRRSVCFEELPALDSAADGRRQVACPVVEFDPSAQAGAS